MEVLLLWNTTAGHTDRSNWTDLQDGGDSMEP
jgi:hypothetical protein